MKIMTLALLLLAFPVFSVADIVKIETNDWSNQRTLTWSGILQKIDPSSQVAYFSFRNGSRVQEFQVHITRIYSLALDTQDRVDRPFPTTQQDLKTPLPTNPRSVEILELTNENLVSDSIPTEVKIRRADRGSPILYLSGTIERGDLQKFKLKVKAGHQATTEFEIGRSDLLKWIRGR